MGNEDFGDCPRETSQEPSSRPLKKAKYVWQLKGKHHLKSNNKKQNVSSTSSSSSSSSSKTPEGQLGGSDCERQKTGQVEEKGKCIDKFLARTEAILDNVEDGSSASNTNDVPVSLVPPIPKTDEFYWRKWQSRQIARGYIDNMINSALETWAPIPEIDAEDFMENCDDTKVEDEGILMAIQAHGLDTNRPEEESSQTEVVENTAEKISSSSSSSSSNKPSVYCEPPEMGFMHPVDLLNAAILVAIDRKGLSTSQYQ